MTEGLLELMSKASVTERPEPKFNVICPLPGCRFTKNGKTAPIVIKVVSKWKRTRRARNYIYIVVNHYNGQKNKKNSYASHSIGKVTKTGIVMKYRSPNEEEIRRKVALKADTISHRKSGRSPGATSSGR